MKTLLVLTLFAAGLASAQIPANQMTGGLKNGRYWITQDHASKVDFLVGFADALNDQETKLHFAATFGETAKGLDQFYDDPANAVIPIRDALGLFANKVRGEGPESLAQLAAMLRSIWAAVKPDAPEVR